MANTIEIHRQAVEQLKIAADALDQAHAMLRDINLHNYIDTGRGPYRQTLESAFNVVCGLLKDLENVQCPDCGKPMSDVEECLAGRCPSISEEDASNG